MKTSGWAVVLALVAGAVAAGGCKTTYYRTMEAFGKEKRDLLVNRVEKAQESQEEAKEQFRSALDRFSELTQFDGGELRRAYDKASDELEASEQRAEEVRERVRSVAEVGEDLFEEWEEELSQYSSDSLRRNSERQMRETRRQYDAMLQAMRRAEASMDPVLSAFKDNVLFLKHNLNARAVASLQGDVEELQRDIDALIRDMERSIAEAEQFVQQMQAEG